MTGTQTAARLTLNHAPDDQSGPRTGRDQHDHFSFTSRIYLGCRQCGFGHAVDRRTGASHCDPLGRIARQYPSASANGRTHRQRGQGKIRRAHRYPAVPQWPAGFGQGHDRIRLCRCPASDHRRGGGAQCLSAAIVGDRGALSVARCCPSRQNQPVAFDGKAQYRAGCQARHAHAQCHLLRQAAPDIGQQECAIPRRYEGLQIAGSGGRCVFGDGRGMGRARHTDCLSRTLSGPVAGCG